MDGVAKELFLKIYELTQKSFKYSEVIIFAYYSTLSKYLFFVDSLVYEAFVF